MRRWIRTDPVSFFVFSWDEEEEEEEEEEADSSDLFPLVSWHCSTWTTAVACSWLVVHAICRSRCVPSFVGRPRMHSCTLHPVVSYLVPGVPEELGIRILGDDFMENGVFSVLRLCSFLFLGSWVPVPGCLLIGFLVPSPGCFSLCVAEHS